MTRPSPDERPTSVLPQQTAGQPEVTTAGPAAHRPGFWQHVPARIGRARTSTVVIGCLFILLFALNTALPRDEGETTTVTTSDGQTIQVRKSDLPDDYVPPATTTPTTTAPARTSTPATTSRAPQTSEDDQETTPATTSRAPSTSSAPTTSRAPSTSAAPTSSGDDEPSASSSAPTS